MSRLLSFFKDADTVFPNLVDADAARQQLHQAGRRIRT
jgi:hypothetical protein